MHACALNSTTSRHRSGPISPARRAFVIMMSCSCYSTTAGHGEWHEFCTSFTRVLHEFGTRFARVWHEFARANEFGTSFARVWHEFCTSFACGLHEFGTSFARRHAYVMNSPGISSPERSNLVTGAVRSLRHAELL